ncbi:MAG: CsbD family protein [Gemmatimonadales bacterium]
MDSNTTQGNWKVLKGKVKERWGKLTDDELDVLDGKHDQLVGLIQKRYGEAKESVERQLDEWKDVDYEAADQAGRTP